MKMLKKSECRIIAVQTHAFILIFVVSAKCVSLLGIIMVVSWLLEIITFYSGSNSNYLILCDMVNGLQGVWVLLIFLVVRRRRTIILRWWYDRGSHEIEGTELQALSNSPT